MLTPWWEKFGLSGVAASLLMVRVAVCWPTIGWPEAIGLFLCLVVHYGKVWIEESQPSGASEEVLREISQLQGDVELLESKMSGIELSKGITSSGGEDR